MRFGIFRRFSHLIHRRTKSDSTTISQVAPISTVLSTVLPSSMSLGGFQTQYDTPTNILDVVPPPAPAVSPLLPLAFSQSTSPRTPSHEAGTLAIDAIGTINSPPFSRSDTDTLLRLSAVQKQASDLAAQSLQLEASIEALKIETGFAEGAARKAKSDLEQIRSLAKRQKRRSAELESQVNAKKQELAQYQAFVNALSEAGIVPPRLETEKSEPDNKEDFEEIAVEAIREASNNNTGIWSRIMTFVIGPRAPDNYVNTINMTLRARQELRYWKKVSNFWKKAAREGNANAGVPTPSSSNLSEVKETLSDERKEAVIELREKRKTLGLNAFHASMSSDSVYLPYRLPDSHPSFTSIMSTMSNAESGRESSTDQRTSRLPPLASDVFKQALISSHSSQRLFNNSSRKIRPSSSDSLSARFSEKALGKRRVVETGGSFSSMPSADVLSGVPIDSSVIDLPSSKGAQLSSNPPGSSSLGLGASASRTTYTHNSLRSAERPLESFERICNRFSSGSNIGSLRSISEELTESSISNSRSEGPQIVVDSGVILGLGGSGSFSGSGSRPSSKLADNLERERVGLVSGNVLVSGNIANGGDETLIESGSEGSNQGLAASLEPDNDRTLIDVEVLDHKTEGSKVAVTKLDAGSGCNKSKSRLPIFRIPNRLSQMSKMTGSSTRRSLSSFQSRNSSSTISTQASRERETSANSLRVDMHAHLPISIKPVLPLRIVKKVNNVTTKNSVVPS